MGTQSLIVLDTHALVWLIQEDNRLGLEARKSAERAFAARRLHVCSISAWEVAMLVDRGRLDLGCAPGQWIDAILLLDGIMLTTVEPTIAVDAGTLPASIHGDPCDRILIATARAFGCPLLTADHAILRYGAAGHVRVIDASV